MTYQETDNIDEKNIGSEEFATMLDESINGMNTNLKKGDVVVGKISGITDSHLLISLGVKQDAVAELGDYLENGTLSYQIGDDIKGFIVRMTDDQIIIAKSLNRSHGNKVLIKEAFEKNIPVKGKVISVIKGGFTVEIFGVKAFCPISHMDFPISLETIKYINNTYDFEIIEMLKNSIILSRKNLLLKIVEERKELFFSKVKIDDIIFGTVIRITKFGAFLDLDGFEGLLHNSELSWDHRDKAEKKLKIGETVQVKVIRLDPEKVSVSIKALVENPTAAFIKKLSIGDVVKCKVIRHEDFGSFVEIEKGVEGLIPISQMSNKRINKPSDVLTIGDYIEAKVVKIDENNLKISLSIKEEEVDTWDIDTASLRQGQICSGVLENITEHGAFVKINNTVVGLIPISKLKKAKLEFTMDNLNDDIEVRISSINVQSKKISLEPIIQHEQEAKKFEKREPREKSKKERSSDHDNKKYKKDFSQDNDWKKYATGYQSVPEDNPFNKL